MKKITLTKKADKVTWNAVTFCERARSRDNRKPALKKLAVTRNRLAATDGNRLHYTKIKGISSGLYDYQKVKSTITLTPVEGTYPDINTVIPKTYAHKIKVHREELLHLAKNAMIISNERYRSMIMTFNGRLDIKSVNPDIGTMEGHIETSWFVDPEISIYVNPQFVIDALKDSKTDLVTININGPKNAVVLNDSINTGLIMPMRA